MLSRVSSKRVRTAAPTRATAAPPARTSAGTGVTPGGSQASKQLEDLLASYVNQHAPQTKKITFSLKSGGDKQTSVNYPADIAAPVLRESLGIFFYAGKDEAFTTSHLGVKFLKLQNKFEVQASQINLAQSTQATAAKSSFNPTSMSPSQIHDYYQKTLSTNNDSAINISTRIKKTFDTLDQAVKYVFGDVAGVEFFLDEELNNKVSSDAVVKAITSGTASYRFAPKGSWALPQELQAELKA